MNNQFKLITAAALAMAALTANAMTSEDKISGISRHKTIDKNGTVTYVYCIGYNNHAFYPNGRAWVHRSFSPEGNCSYRVFYEKNKSERLKLSIPEYYAQPCFYSMDAKEFHQIESFYLREKEAARKKQIGNLKAKL
jgi:hypothetical protein